LHFSKKLFRRAKGNKKEGWKLIIETSNQAFSIVECIEPMTSDIIFGQ